MTFDVSQLESGIRLVRLLQYWNMKIILVTLDVFQSESGVRSVRLLQLENM